MNREECEVMLLKKFEELISIAKEYDKSEDFYLNVAIVNGYITVNNQSWETDTPINAYYCLSEGRMHQVECN